MPSLVAVALLVSAALAAPVPAATDPDAYTAQEYRAAVSTARPLAGEGFEVTLDADPGLVVVLSVEAAGAPVSPAALTTREEPGTPVVRIDGRETTTSHGTTDRDGHIAFQVEVDRPAQCRVVLATATGEVLFDQVVEVVAAQQETSAGPAATGEPSVAGPAVAVVAVLLTGGAVLLLLRRRRRARS
ncbi:hypothetical protein [Cellulomonas sp. C5510]|uniref:hypothetical protein n=1 Tax=Cellulomonas sp. C5510 TaxID=2871170 RepID=UPI0021036693|nr:hypothetical protein [Cellulomonas sp. C5510]